MSVDAERVSLLELVELRADLCDRRARTLRERGVWLSRWRLADIRVWRQMSPTQRQIARSFAVPPRLLERRRRARRSPVARWVKPMMLLAVLVIAAVMYRDI
jgi:hypothetical protein